MKQRRRTKQRAQVKGEERKREERKIRADLERMGEGNEIRKEGEPRKRTVRSFFPEEGEEIKSKETAENDGEKQGEIKGDEGERRVLGDHTF